MITGSIAQLRRLTNEPSTSGTYSDAEMSAYMGQFGGELYSAAHAIWMEKASALANVFNFQSDGERMEVSQKREFAERMVAYYANKRIARSSLWVKTPEEVSDLGYIEPDPEDLQ